MGMVVRTNTMALNANRQLSNNNNQVAKSLEKLSSGFRINRAGDDASGLAISEKMKAQIKGLEQASTNSQDGISLVQTAEGALTEVHNMLNRMVELATKSANGTIQNEVDRENIQNEVDALTAEINRIGNATNFNGINLLDGTMGSASGAAAAFKINAYGVGADGTVHSGTSTAAVYNTASVTTADPGAGKTVAAGGKYTVEMTNQKTGEKKTVEIATGSTITGGTTTATQITDMMIADMGANSTLNQYFEFTNNAGALDITSKGLDQGWEITDIDSADADLKTAVGGAAVNMAGEADPSGELDFGTAFVAGDKLTVNGKSYEIVAADGDKATTSGYKAVTAAKLADVLSKATGMDVTDDGAGKLTFAPKAATTAATGGAGSLTLQIGDTNAAYNKLTVTVGDMRADALGVGSVDVSTQDAAGAQIDVIKAAINTVSTTRGDLGALQNRLEYTINNLDTTAENMTAANSRIRDTDMAKEMMNYTKMNVLVQSAQAMLAQANQQPQSILQLLQ